MSKNCYEVSGEPLESFSETSDDTPAYRQAGISKRFQRFLKKQLICVIAIGSFNQRALPIFRFF
jgi:hypothetical protein